MTYRDRPDDDTNTHSSRSSDQHGAEHRADHDTGHGTQQGATSAGERRSTAGADRADREELVESRRHEEYGGLNWGAAFFGWLVAIAMTILLTGIVGAVLAAIGSEVNVTQSDAEQDAGTIGIATAIILLLILMLGYYAGGYVAGRMSRYDGGRQGAGVWIIGLVITLIVVGVGVLAGSEYNIFERVNLPSLPIPTDEATIGGLITLAAVVLGTLLAAILGGKAGRHYHRKVDRVGV